MSKFGEIVNEILTINGWHPVSQPAILVEDWETFTRECEDGYNWTIYEYDNEIRVREKIELLLTSPELRGYEEFQELFLKVTSIDTRMKALFMPQFSRKNKRYWWEQGVLKYAGKEYAEDINQTYGLEVKIV